MIFYKISLIFLFESFLCRIFIDSGGQNGNFNGSREYPYRDLESAYQSNKNLQNLSFALIFQNNSYNFLTSESFTNHETEISMISSLQM